jgi:hypothetical protein
MDDIIHCALTETVIDVAMHYTFGGGEKGSYY